MEWCNRAENEIHINMSTNNTKSRYVVKPHLGEAVLDSTILFRLKNIVLENAINTALWKQRAFVWILVLSRANVPFESVSGCRGSEEKCSGCGKERGKGECCLPYRKFRVVLVISLFVFNVSDWQTTWRASGGSGNNVPGETCVCARWRRRQSGGKSSEML